jgi:hypothetical protein
VGSEKSLAAILADTKRELKEFFQTRVQLLRSEITEKLSIWKYSVPLLVLSAGLLLMAWVVLTFALVAMIRAWFLPNQYAWLWAGLIVAGIYLIAGCAVGWFAYTELLAAGLGPKRTLQVLKQDQMWVQNETRIA